jgi:hypothetical protein
MFYIRSHTIKYMKTSFSLAEDVGIAYFYCSFDDLASQDPLNILGSLVAQISPQVPKILEYLAPKFRAAVETNQPREFVLQDLETSFAQHTAAFSRMFLLVDAVNESERSTEIVELLFRVAEQCKNARVLITSTWDLGRKMLKTPQKILEIEMCTRDIREDICLYIDSTLTEDSNLGGYSEELKQNIREAVLGRAAGMYVVPLCFSTTITNSSQVSICQMATRTSSCPEDWTRREESTLRHASRSERDICASAHAIVHELTRSESVTENPPLAVICNPAALSSRASRRGGP